MFLFGFCFTHAYLLKIPSFVAWKCCLGKQKWKSYFWSQIVSSGCIDGWGHVCFPLYHGAFCSLQKTHLFLGLRQRSCWRINKVSMLYQHNTENTKPPFINSSRAALPQSLPFSLSSSVCHRLMSRLASQVLLLAASPNPTLSKKGCFRASASGSRLEGS